MLPPLAAMVRVITTTTLRSFQDYRLLPSPLHQSHVKYSAEDASCDSMASPSAATALQRRRRCCQSRLFLSCTSTFFILAAVGCRCGCGNVLAVVVVVGSGGGDGGGGQALQRAGGGGGNLRHLLLLRLLLLPRLLTPTRTTMITMTRTTRSTNFNLWHLA